jgi:phthalate 4,5-cis-dihydrodiol dehydrogenase
MTTTRETSGEGAGAAAKQLKMGMIGIGVGGAEMLLLMEVAPEIDLMAGADINPVTRRRFQARYETARVYETAEAMCKDPDLEAVWISSPNRFHAEHSILAANHGKHVVVEKPMALSIQQAEEMIRAAEKNGVKLMAGHTRAYTLPIRAMRKIILSGKLGKLRAINVMAYTDWMLRPRSAEELDPKQGGGIPYRQGPHQIDTIRLLGGGKLRSVRAATGQWMPERPIPGYYSGYMEFADGTPVTLSHNGYGYFLGAELVPWGESAQRYNLDQRIKVRKEMETGTRDEEADKQDLRIGGEAEDYEFRRYTRGGKPWVPEDLGLLIVSCERGDIRHSAHGLYVYDDDGMHEIDLTPDRIMGGSGQRRAELEEFYDAIVGGKPLYHDGNWGIGTLEATLALMESSREKREIELQHQVEMPAAYDEEFSFPYLEGRA